MGTRRTHQMRKLDRRGAGFSFRSPSAAKQVQIGNFAETSQMGSSPLWLTELEMLKLSKNHSQNRSHVSWGQRLWLPVRELFPLNTFFSTFLAFFNTFFWYFLVLLLFKLKPHLSSEEALAACEGAVDNIALDGATRWLNTKKYSIHATRWGTFETIFGTIRPSSSSPFQVQRELHIWGDAAIHDPPWPQCRLNRCIAHCKMQYKMQPLKKPATKTNSGEKLHFKQISPYTYYTLVKSLFSSSLVLCFHAIFFVNDIGHSTDH